MTMTCYVVDSYHGPLVFTQNADSWKIDSPYRPSEVFAGTIPPDCLVHARQVGAHEVERILAGHGPDLGDNGWAQVPQSVLADGVA
jgi:hypothetical protein